jgi:hypothetical protein
MMDLGARTYHTPSSSRSHAPRGSDCRIESPRGAWGQETRMPSNHAPVRPWRRAWGLGTGRVGPRETAAVAGMQVGSRDPTCIASLLETHEQIPYLLCASSPRAGFSNFCCTSRSRRYVWYSHRNKAFWNEVRSKPPD